MATQHDPWNIPTYSPTETGRLVKLQPQRVKRWLLGYSYDYSPQGTGRKTRVKHDPVLSRDDASGSPYASFLDLIDLLFVKQFIDHGLSLQKLRLALTEASELVDGHHFAQRKFFTDGRAIFINISDDAPALMQLLSGGQWAIATVIQSIAKQIKFDPRSGFAERWYPLGVDQHVVLDPRIGFGAPTIIGSGVDTANVYDLYLGEGRSVERTSKWTGLRSQEVRAAVLFEERMVA